MEHPTTADSQTSKNVGWLLRAMQMVERIRRRGEKWHWLSQLWSGHGSTDSRERIGQSTRGWGWRWVWAVWAMKKLLAAAVGRDMILFLPKLHQGLSFSGDWGRSLCDALRGNGAIRRHEQHCSQRRSCKDILLCWSHLDSMAPVQEVCAMLVAGF